MKYKPTWCCNSIFEIDYEILKKNNIRYILTDLDNTLAPYNVAIPGDEVIELISNIKKAGFKIIIASNNTGKRVKLFASKLNVNYISGAKKPFISVISKYLRNNNIKIEECILIGDQLMTDIRCACRLNCRCILTNPLSKEESIVTFVNRKIDSYLRKKYNLMEECQRIDRSGK